MWTCSGEYVDFYFLFFLDFFSFIFDVLVLWGDKREREGKGGEGGWDVGGCRGE